MRLAMASRWGLRAPLALLLLVRAVPLLAQEARIHMVVDTSVVTVGDRITLTVAVDHSPESQVVWPDSLDLQPFEVLSASLLPPVASGETVRSSANLTLIAFELGDLEIPSFDLEVVDPSGTSAILPTNAYGIQVLSVGLDESGDIREIRGPLGIPLNPMGSFLVTLGVVLAAALLWILSKRLRKKPEERPTETVSIPVRPPHEVALEALDRLVKSPLLERGQIKEFHIQVSDILRTYIEARFGVPALEMTTQDITSGLQQAGVEPSVVDSFRRFLDSCDMVKFAKNRPGVEASSEVLDLGRELVKETIPVPALDPSPSVEKPEVNPATDGELEEAKV